MAGDQAVRTGVTRDALSRSNGPDRSSRHVAATRADSSMGRAVAAACALLGIATLFTGVWAFVAPGSFYDVIAPFEPYNRHFLHDAGAFNIGVSTALLLVAARQSGPIVGLGGYTVSAVLHFISHVVDRDLGGNPSRDFPYLAFLAIAGIAALAAVMRGSRRESAAGGQ